jgi:hypothetical protein
MGALAQTEIGREPLTLACFRFSEFVENTRPHLEPKAKQKGTVTAQLVSDYVSFAGHAHIGNSCAMTVANSGLIGLLLPYLLINFS